MSAILSVENLVAGYEPGLPIVNGVSIEAQRGEIVAILGPNGAGKSTLIKAVAGMAAIVSGAVRFNGRDIAQSPAHLRIREGLAFAPQTENVFAQMSVEDNLKLAAGLVDAPRRTPRIAAMYEAFPDLKRQRSLLAGRLSGGQRQMLAIARALVVEPLALMLDEPSAGLAPKAVEAVFASLAEIGQSGVTILLVEQNTRAALKLADRAYVLVQGRNRHQGRARDLAQDPEIAALYLGGVAKGDTA